MKLLNNLKKKIPLQNKSKLSVGNLRGLAKVLTLLKFLGQWFLLGSTENFWFSSNIHSDHFFCLRLISALLICMVEVFIRLYNSPFFWSYYGSDLMLNVECARSTYSSPLYENTLKKEKQEIEKLC